MYLVSVIDKALFVPVRRAPTSSQSAKYCSCATPASQHHPHTGPQHAQGGTMNRLLYLMVAVVVVVVVCQLEAFAAADPYVQPDPHCIACPPVDCPPCMQPVNGVCREIFGCTT